MVLRIEEAIARSRARGKVVKKKDLAKKLFPDTTESNQIVNMSNICRGKTKRVDPDWIVTICLECDCTPNYLFGFEN